MAVSSKIRITRDKLAEFVPDHDTIRQLEILIGQINLFSDIWNAVEEKDVETWEQFVERITTP
jgi:hypothetical protein